MSNTIDNRVVQMEFDNKQFENGAKTTMTTLEKLKQSLNFNSSVNSLSKLESAARTFTLNGVTNSIDVVCDKFSAMGVVGATVIQNLTNSAMAMARKITGLLTTPLIEGGKNRALNIEQAKFQLEGLGVAWETIKDDINYGVKDTAYGLDAAAKVASQLVASNIEVGDSMKTALRGVSGVAAMTNSSYEEIGHIFTTVAGNGKLMTEQLRMLSARGLNIAAELGKQLGKSEAEIREMVSKGQIDFKTFSEAMDNAFGEHAKDANKTFTGSLSNMRAALSRIGADVATPAFENLRKAINALTPVIDGVHTALTPVIALLTTGMEKASNYAVKVLDSFCGAEEKNLDDLADIANKVIAGEFGFGEERRKNLEALGYAYDDVQSKVNEFLSGTSSRKKAVRDFGKLTGIVATFVKAFTNLGSGIVQAVKPIKESFEKAFPRITLDMIQKFADTIEQLTAKFKISDSTAEKLRKTFTGLFQAVDMVKRFGISLIQSLSPFLSVFGEIGEKILNVTAAIGDYISKLSEAEKKNFVFAKAFQKVSEFIGNALDKVKEMLSGVSEKVKGVLSKVKPKLAELKKLFSSLFDSFSEGYKSVTGKDFRIPTFKELLGLIGKIKDKFVGTALSVGKSDNEVVKFFKSFIPDKDTIIEKLKVGFENLGVLIGTVKEKVSAFKEELPKIKQNITDFLGHFKLKDSNKKTAVIEGIANTLDFASGIISKVSPKIGEGLSNISQAFRNTFTGIDYGRMAKLLNVGFFVVLYTAVNKLKGVLSTLGSFGRPLHNLNGVFVGVKSTLTAYTNDLKTNTLLKIAGAIGILSLSLIALSAVDAEKLRSAVSAMMFLFVSLMSSMLLIQWVAEIQVTKSFDLTVISTALIGVSVAISILTTAVKKLAALDPQRLFVSLMGVMALIAALAMFLRETNFGLFYTPSVLQQGAAILLISAAVMLLAEAVKKLSAIDTVSLIKGLLSVVTILAAFAGFSHIVVKSVNLLSLAISFALISFSLMSFAKSVGALGELSISTIGKGLLAIAAGLAIIGTAVHFMPINLKSVGVGLVVVSAALYILAKALNQFADTSWESLAKGLIAMVVSLAAIATALRFMTTALPGAAALFVAAAALAAIAPSIKLLGSLSWSGVLTGLIALAGALAVLGGAAVILAPAIPAMLALSGVMVTMGAGMLALGAGMALLAAGIGALAVSSVSIGAFVAALTTGISVLVEGLVFIVSSVLEGIASIIGKIVEVVWQIIITLITGISDHIGLIVDAGMTIIIALLRGLSENMDTIVILAVVIISKFLNGISKMIPTIIKAGINLVVSLLNGMADGIRNNGGIVLEAIKNLISSIVEFAVTAMQEVVLMIPGVGQTLSDELENAKTAIRKTLTGDTMNGIGKGAVKDTVGGITDNYDMGHSAGEGLGNSVLDGLSGVFGEFGSLGNGIGLDFSKSLDGTSGLSWDSGNNLGSSALSGLETSLTDFSSLGLDFGQNFSDSLSSTDGLAADSAENIGNSIFDGLNLDLTSLGSNAGDTYAQGIESKESESGTAAGRLSYEAALEMKKAALKFKHSGSDNGREYTKGIDSQKSRANRSGYDVAESGRKGISSRKGSYNEIGRNLGHEYAQGLRSSMAEIDSAGSDMADTAIDAIRRKLNRQNNSASQAFSRAGKESAKEMTNVFSQLTKAEKYVDDTASSSLKNALSKAMNFLNGEIEVDPIIRPVIDLSNVKAGADSINGMFGNRTVALAGNIQNAERFKPKTSAEEASNNRFAVSSDMVKAISELRGDISYLGERISRMQVVLDNGALVGSMVGPMDEALGRRSIRKGRGN